MVALASSAPAASPEKPLETTNFTSNPAVVLTGVSAGSATISISITATIPVQRTIAVPHHLL